MTDNIADKSTFKNKYIGKNTAAIVILSIFLFIGFVMFLQFCLTPSLDSDPSGSAASSAEASGDGEDVDPACIGCGQGFALLIIVICSVILTYFIAKGNSVSKLIDNAEFAAAAKLGGNSAAKSEADLIFELQAQQLLEEASAKGIEISNVECPVEYEEEEEYEE